VLLPCGSETFALLSSAYKFKQASIQNCKLSAHLYGCETWSVTLREQYRLRVVDYRLLRSMFGSKTDDIIGDQRKLRNEELNDLYCSADSTGVIR
jgi:hypothetical protein